MRRLFISIFLVLICFSFVFAAPQVQPQVQVKAMVDSILGVLQQEELTPLEKKEQVSGMVQEFLDINSMSRRTLGVHWQTATLEQRQQFSALFVQILEGTYLNRIGDYSGGTVEYLKQRVKGNKAIVDTVIIAKELEIPVQYKMIYVDDTWQVFDLVIEGVSLVRNYHSSYGEIIRRNGYDGLLRLMEEKVQSVAN